MDYKSLEKTFNIKIPIYQHADYYIETLKRSPQFKDIDKHIEMFKEYEEFVKSKGMSVKDDKMQTITELVSHLHNNGYVKKLVDWKTPKNIEFEKVGFNPKDGSSYVSIDINEANWTVSKYFLELDYPKWEEFCSNLAHPTLSKSKSFRQYVFGNIAPKKLATMQRCITADHIKMLPKKYKENIKMVSEDEIVIKISEAADVRRILNQEWIVPVKAKPFKTNLVDTGDGETIRVDTVYDIVDDQFVEKYKELKGVPGDRFFLHFKSLILNEKPEHRDLLFLNNKHIAKWVI